jgi:DNA-binding transcriptional LysR family regulator
MIRYRTPAIAPARGMIVVVDLDLGHARSFLAVVDTGGYHRAAETLHLSQPAVSKHVRLLEQRLGGSEPLPFFRRVGRGVALTERGEEVVAALRPVLAEHDRTMAVLTRDAGAGAPFLFGIVEHLVDPLLPEIVSGLRTAVGGRDVLVRIDRSTRLVDRVAAGELDAALVLDPSGGVALPAAAADLGTVALQWFAGGALAGRPLADPVPIVSYDAPCHLRDLTIAHLERSGRAYRVAAESPHATGVLSAVRAGLGVALLLASADGLTPIAHDVLDAPPRARLWFVGDEPASGTVAAMRAVLGRGSAPGARRLHAA